MTVREALALAADLPVHEALRLLEKATGVKRARLLTGGQLEEDAAACFAELVARRRSGEPLQYIEGTVQFGPVTLAVDHRALIPRPETEQLWELVVRLVPAPRTVVDLCTGSGNLALACKHVWPDARVLATDASAKATVLAMENADRLGLDIEVLRGDLFAPLPVALRGSVDLVVANPPYLAEHELAALESEVRDHEPHEALVAGPTGIEVLARIASEAASWLAHGGSVACEISEVQEASARTLFSELGGRVFPDLAGRPRFVVGRRS